MDALIPEEVLERLIPPGPTSEEERAYAYYRFLDEGEESPLKFAAEARLYNRYFWFGVFAKRRQVTSGYDAGIEQQHFQMLESAPPGVDWNTVERLAALIAQK